MKAKFMGAITLAVVLLLVFAVVAQAAVLAGDHRRDHQGREGRPHRRQLDGRGDPRGAARTSRTTRSSMQYSKIKGVLEDYLASLQGPGEQGGQLAFTGGEIILILGAGAGLIGSGALLRRRRA